MSTCTVLEVRELGVRYGRRRILDDVSFSLDAGSSLSIVGRSGSGKSTLLQCLALLQRPTTGDVVVCGSSSADLRASARARARRDHIGVVLQDGNLVDDMTVLDNVRVALDLRRVRGSRERAIDALERVGLGDRSGARPSELSGGEAQRVAVARVMALRLPLVLLDEPTAALDPSMRDELTAGFDMLRDNGAAMVVVTHDVRVAAWGDRTGLLSDGVLKIHHQSLTTNQIEDLVAGRP